jgi:hypothetical protein
MVPGGAAGDGAEVGTEGVLEAAPASAAVDDDVKGGVGTTKVLVLELGTVGGDGDAVEGATDASAEEEDASGEDIAVDVLDEGTAVVEDGATADDGAEEDTDSATLERKLELANADVEEDGVVAEVVTEGDDDDEEAISDVAEGTKEEEEGGDDDEVGSGSAVLEGSVDGVELEDVASEVATGTVAVEEGGLSTPGEEAMLEVNMDDGDGTAVVEEIEEGRAELVSKVAKLDEPESSVVEAVVVICDPAREELTLPVSDLIDEMEFDLAPKALSVTHETALGDMDTAVCVSSYDFR